MFVTERAGDDGPRPRHHRARAEFFLCPFPGTIEWRGRDREGLREGHMGGRAVRDGRATAPGRRAERATNPTNDSKTSKKSTSKARHPF